MTTPTDDPKVKELLEVATVVGAKLSCGVFPSDDEREKLDAAVFAFDPPKPKQYLLPDWGSFVREHGPLRGEDGYIALPAPNSLTLEVNQTAYNILREATAKD